MPPVTTKLSSWQLLIFDRYPFHEARRFLSWNRTVVVRMWYRHVHYTCMLASTNGTFPLIIMHLSIQAPCAWLRPPTRSLQQQETEMTSLMEKPEKMETTPMTDPDKDDMPVIFLLCWCNVTYSRYFAVTVLRVKYKFFIFLFILTLNLHCWCRSVAPVNSLRPRQNRRHFADDVFKCNFSNKNVWIPIKMSLKFVPKGPINNIPAFGQIMVGAEQSTSHYLNQW